MTAYPWVFVGAEVALFPGGSYLDHCSGFRKITKIYKNGNFILNSGYQQYRPQSDLAYSTQSGFHPDSVRPMTDDLMARLARAKAKRDGSAIIRIEIARLNDLAMSGDAYAILAEAAAIVERIKP